MHNKFKQSNRKDMPPDFGQKQKKTEIPKR
jgi:hypothetical protein